MVDLRSKLVTAAAVGAAAIGGAAIANAATSGSSSTSTSTAPPGYGAQQGPPQGGGQPQGRHSVNGKTEEPLSGAKAAKVRGAALAKVPGTVERVETNVDGSAPYEAHIRKSDGTSVEVQVGSDYKVVAVNEMGQHP